MRILLLADIHGNRAALEAVREPHDLCLVLGDLVDYGPEPAACVEWVRRHAHVAVRGNHDHGVAQDVEVQGVGGFRFLTACTRPFSVAALSAVQRRYLADLPTSMMLTIEGKRFFLVHATPRDPMDEYAHPDPAFWAPRVAGLGVDYVCVGHTHQPYTLEGRVEADRLPGGPDGPGAARHDHRRDREGDADRLVPGRSGHQPPRPGVGGADGRGGLTEVR